LLAGNLAGHELIRRLPKRSADKLIALQGEQDNLTASYTAAVDGAPKLRDRLHRAKSRLDEVSQLPPYSPEFLGHRDGASQRHFLPAGEDREKAVAAMRQKVVDQVQQEFDDARRAVDAVNEQCALLGAKRSAVPARCISFVQGVPENVPIDEFTGRVEVPAGDPRQAVAVLRDRLVALNEQRAAAAAAPYPKADQCAIVRATVEAMAARGRPDLSRCLQRLSPVFVTDRVKDAQGVPTLQTYSDGLLFEMWLRKDEIIDRLIAEIELGDASGALSDKERRQLDIEIASQLLRTEREIEATIMAAAASGTEIKRADAASVIAVLNLHSDLEQFAGG
jgi:hypothetical protein